MFYQLSGHPLTQSSGRIKSAITSPESGIPGPSKAAPFYFPGTISTWPCSPAISVPRLRPEWPLLSVIQLCVRSTAIERILERTHCPGERLRMCHPPCSDRLRKRAKQDHTDGASNLPGTWLRVSHALFHLRLTMRLWSRNCYQFHLIGVEEMLRLREIR